MKHDNGKMFLETAKVNMIIKNTGDIFCILFRIYYLNLKLFHQEFISNKVSISKGKELGRKVRKEVYY